MSELKPCPFCGEENTDTGFILHKDECYLMLRYMGGHSKQEMINAWNTRPIEDGLQAEIDRLKEKLHDELSQLEIATDLGNKRWLALNDIYKDGEKHNVDWCKRKAQEGLGIK